eukprot:Gb_08730 [translate_table: standard]
MLKGILDSVRKCLVLEKAFFPYCIKASF